MQKLEEQYRESAPTVLELSGFDSALLARLRTAFLENLQQPSFVSRAQVKNSGRTCSMVLACPLGLLLSASWEGGCWTVESLSLCCGAPPRWGDSCSTCNKSMAEYAYHFTLSPLAPEEFDAEGKSLGAPTGEAAAEEALAAALEKRNVSLLSAMIIVGELMGLLTEVAHLLSSKE